MAATKNINIRLSPERKQALQELADAFGESITEFVMKSVYARVRSVQGAAVSATDPFVLAMRSAAKNGKTALDREERAAINASRQARAKGAKGVSVREARRRLLEG